MGAARDLLSNRKAWVGAWRNSTASNWWVHGSAGGGGCVRPCVFSCVKGGHDDVCVVLYGGKGLDLVPLAGRSQIRFLGVFQDLG
jgi:hypothetical protein